MPNISFQNVKKVYPNGTYALDGVSFEINQGDFIAIMGESGGGKTTLLKLIAGIEHATSGEIYFDNEISNLLKVQKRDVAFVFQEYTIYPHMTVFENIVFSLQKEKIPYEDKCQLAFDIIKQMKLELIQSEVPKHLSFGQCQKVALARALIRKPKIILFDEPLSNIDASAKEEFKKLILEAKKILPDSTFIYVTHKVDDAMKLANKIMIINEGKLIQYDTKRIIYEYPCNKNVLEYLLDSKEEYIGKFDGNKFISQEYQKELKDFDLNLLDKKDVHENVTCVHTSRWDYFFNENGDSIFNFKNEYYVDANYQNNKLILLDKEIDVSSIVQAIVNYDFNKIILYRNSFTFNEIEDVIEFDATVSYINSDYLIIKINDLYIPFINDNHYELNEQIKLYYPINKIKGIDNKGNVNIASYFISDNICDCEIINKNKGLVKLGKIKFTCHIDEKYRRRVKVKIPLDAFILDKKGKFKCDILHNEENLINQTLLHFSTNKVNEYLSMIVNQPFRGYKNEKIKYNIDLNKIIVVGGE